MKLSPAPTVSTTSTRGRRPRSARCPKWRARRVRRESLRKTADPFSTRPKALLDRAAGVEPLEVLFARLDHMSERSLPLDERLTASRSGVTNGRMLGSKLTVAPSGARAHRVDDAWP